MAQSDPNRAVWDRLHTMHETLQTQPGGMPSLDAPVEDWQRWTQTVAPKDISVYGDLKPTLTEEQAHLKDVVEQVYQPDFLNTITEAARQVGVQPFQMKALMDAYNNIELKVAEQYLTSQQQQAQLTEQQKIEAEAKLNKDFDDYCLQKFGTEREKIVGTGFDFLAKNVDKEMVDAVNALPNEALATVAALAYQMKQKYEKEDRLPNAGAMYTGEGDSHLEIKNKINDLVNSKAFSDFRDPAHELTMTQVTQLSTQLARLEKPRAKY
jgi:hypothetical protein